MARQLVTARIIVDTDDWQEAERLVHDLIINADMNYDVLKWEETLAYVCDFCDTICDTDRTYCGKCMEDDPNMNDDDGNDHTEFDRWKYVGGRMERTIVQNVRVNKLV